MKRSLVGLIVAAAMAVAPAAADVNVHLVRGAGYPACVAIVAALRRMPPSTPIDTWPERLPPIPGVTQPRWTSLDPTRYVGAIRAFMIQRERQSIIKRERLAPDDRTGDAIWSEIGPSVESHIRSGKLLIEETTIKDVRLGWSDRPADRPWVTDVRFSRIGHVEPVHGTIGSPYQHEPRRTYASWADVAVWISKFPHVHNDLVHNGQGGNNLILVAGQPWFVDGPGVVGILSTNDLEEQDPTLGHHGLDVHEKCFIGWPLLYPPPKGEKP